MPSICVPCAVPHCHPSKRKNRGVSSFVFPVKNAERCKKWILAIKNPKFNENTPPEALQNQRVCSLHFKAEEILRNLLMYQVMGGKFPRATLLVTAVPSINLDEAESAEPQPAEGSRTQASLPEVDSMNRTEVSSTSLEAEVNVVHSATNDASRHVPRTFTAAHETYEANILSLFKRCQICGCAINSTEVRYVRGKMRVKWDCFGGHMGTWKSLLRVKAMLKVDNPEDSLDEEENMMVSEDGSDSNWDPLENSTDGIFTDSDSGTDDSDSGTDEIDAEDDAFGLKLRQLCPDCGKLINIQKAHTCEHKLKPYPCNVCGKRFVSEHHLKVHGRLHKENYKHLCKFCLKTFKTRAHKLAHEQSHPRVKKPYQCPDCPEVFAKIQVRRDHLRNHRGPQQYICHICNMEFAYSNALERHVVTHTGEKQFVCEVCQFSFSQAGHLKSHLRVHTGEKPYQCQHCDKSFNHNVSLKSHIKHYHGKVPDPVNMPGGNCAVPSCTQSVRRNHPADPPISFFTFPVKDPDRCRRWVRAINNPKLNDNTPPSVLQNRRVCTRHFKPEEIERGSLMRCMIVGEPRVKLSDTAVPSINLDEDEAPPAKRRSLTEVNVVPSATKDASPHVPRKFTAAPETYEANILSLFKRCQICGCAINSTDVHYVRGKMRVKWDCFGGHAGTWKSLLRVKAMLKVDNPEDSLDEEENMMVSEDGSDSNWDPVTDSDSGTDEIDAEDDAVGLKLRQLCPDCGKLINIQKAHTCEHKLKPYPCNVCGKRFVSEHHLKVHGRVHKENYKHLCKFCLRTLKTRAHKLAHEQSHPRVKKPYQCPDCPEVFAKIQVRRDHLRNHRGPQQYICHICNMEFPYSNALERHVVVHTGEKQFVCEVCQFSFSQAGHLKSHMRVHTGEKPYQCQHCDKSFNHNVSLKSHIKHCHGKVPDPGMKVQMEKTTRNQSEPEAEKNKMNEMENNTVDVRETHGATLIRGRKKRNRTGRPKGRPQINKMIASDATDKLKRKLCDGDETDESWSNSDSASDSADE